MFDGNSLICLLELKAQPDACWDLFKVEVNAHMKPNKITKK